MIKKVFNIDFFSEGGALTLPTYEVTDGDETCGVHKKVHSDGWVIRGEIREDYFCWVNSFTAVHPIYGTVYGDFESEVFADSEEGFDHFYKNHTPTAWDYYDI